MNDYEYVYTRTRRQLGRPCEFTDTACKFIYESSSTDEPLKERPDHMNPCLLVCGNVPEMSMHSVNTEKVFTESRGQTHTEGGWPKEIDASEPQDTSKWRKRLDKDPQFNVAVSALCKDLKQVLSQNTAVDVFEEYYVGEEAEPEMHSLQSSTCALYKDNFRGLRRSASRISWHPDGGSRFLVSYSCLNFQRPDDELMNKASYIWETENPNYPLFELLPSSPLVCAQYFARNPELVIGGGSNGLLEFFDVRTGSRSVSRSAFGSSHNDPIFDVCWLQSKSHSECVSTSPDGRVIWWDTRRLAEPIDSCALGASGSCLEWQQEAGPTKYLVGTEEGVCLSLNKKPKKPVEVSGWFGATDHGGQYPHYGPIYSVKRNMFHPKYFLTVGDWGAKIWLEELKSPLLQTSPSPSSLTCGGWSPSRAGVVFTGRFDGVVDLYDMHYQMNEIAYSHKIGDYPVSACVIENQGQLMAVGDASGTVTLVRLCDELAVPSGTEKATFGAALEREQRRERNLDGLKKQQTGKTVEKVNFLNKTIDQQQYIGREKEWLNATGLTERPLTVSAAGLN